MPRTETSRRKKTIFFLIAYVILIFLLLVLRLRLDANRISVYNGAILAAQFAICLLIVRRSPGPGLVISILFLSMTLGELVFTLLIRHSKNVIPGIANTLVFIIAIIPMGFLMQRRQREIFTDELTGLLNRHGMMQLIQDKIDEKKKFYLVKIDLENFHITKVNYGQSFADKLEQKISTMLMNELLKTSKVARMSEDDWVFLVEDSSPETTNAIRARIENWVNRKLTIQKDGNLIEVFLNIYAGVVHFPNNETTAEKLLACADIAKSYAKEKNKDHFVFFDESMRQKVSDDIELEKLIRKGIDNDYFYMMYQPQFKIQGKKLRGLESLIRMKTPEGKFISPADFIPVCERSDLIIELDNYVLNRVMKELRDFVREKPETVVSVNVSAKNICKLDFAERVIELLKKNDFPAKSLEIEITEYCIVQSIERTIANIEKLHEAGVMIALDDFGTGYSSLHFLTQLEIDLLKVDKSLVDEIETNKKSLDFVKSVVGIGHMLGCEVISEGVEEDGQLNLLKETGCDFIQGYLWGKPQMLEDIKKLPV